MSQRHGFSAADESQCPAQIYSIRCRSEKRENRFETAVTHWYNRRRFIRFIVFPVED